VAVHPYQRFSAWLLVVLGSLLLLSGTVGLVDAIVHQQWGVALFTLALLAIVVFGTLRGVTQLRAGRRREH
jgi:hypothetical protein